MNATTAQQHAGMDDMLAYAANALTPLQALVILLGECEKSLDFRTSLRKAMAEAHTAIVNAPRAPKRDALMGTLWLDLSEAA